MSYNFTDGAANIRSQNPHNPHQPQNPHNPHNPHPHNIHNPHDPRNRPGNAPPSSTMSPAHLAIPPDQQHLQMLPQLQHHHPQHHPHHPQHHQDPYGGFVQPQPPMAISPVNPRKRRLSDDNTMPGSMPVLSAAPPSAYSDHETFMQGHHVQPEQPSVPMAAPPPPKKSRVNTPWTPAEEHRLKSMRDAGNSWSEIAKSFPNRTEGSVKKHWYKVMEDVALALSSSTDADMIKDMHYAEFAEDEVSRSSTGRANIAQPDPEAQQSAALLHAIKEYEASKWKVIGQKVGKPAKACEQYAKEHFSKDQLGGKG